MASSYSDMSEGEEEEDGSVPEEQSPAMSRTSYQGRRTRRDSPRHQRTLLQIIRDQKKQEHRSLGVRQRIEELRALRLAEQRAGPSRLEMSYNHLDQYFNRGGIRDHAPEGSNVLQLQCFQPRRLQPQQVQPQRLQPQRLQPQRIQQLPTVNRSDRLDEDRSTYVMGIQPVRKCQQRAGDNGNGYSGVRRRLEVVDPAAGVGLAAQIALARRRQEAGNARRHQLMLRGSSEHGGGGDCRRNPQLIWPVALPGPVILTRPIPQARLSRPFNEPEIVYLNRLTDWCGRRPEEDRLMDRHRRNHSVSNQSAQQSLRRICECYARQEAADSSGRYDLQKRPRTTANAQTNTDRSTQAGPSNEKRSNLWADIFLANALGKYYDEPVSSPGCSATPNVRRVTTSVDKSTETELTQSAAPPESSGVIPKEDIPEGGRPAAEAPEKNEECCKGAMREGESFCCDRCGKLWHTCPQNTGFHRCRREESEAEAGTGENTPNGGAVGTDANQNEGDDSADLHPNHKDSKSNYSNFEDWPEDPNSGAHVVPSSNPCFCDLNYEQLREGVVVDIRTVLAQPKASGGETMGNSAISITQSGIPEQGGISAEEEETCVKMKECCTIQKNDGHCLQMIDEYCSQKENFPCGDDEGECRVNKKNDLCVKEEGGYSTKKGDDNCVAKDDAICVKKEANLCIGEETDLCVEKKALCVEKEALCVKKEDLCAEKKDLCVKKEKDLFVENEDNLYIEKKKGLGVEKEEDLCIENEDNLCVEKEATSQFVNETDCCSDEEGGYCDKKEVDGYSQEEEDFCRGTEVDYCCLGNRNVIMASSISLPSCPDQSPMDMRITATGRDWRATYKMYFNFFLGLVKRQALKEEGGINHSDHLVAILRKHKKVTLTIIDSVINQTLMCLSSVDELHSENDS